MKPTKLPEPIDEKNIVLVDDVRGPGHHLGNRPLRSCDAGDVSGFADLLEVHVGDPHVTVGQHPDDAPFLDDREVPHAPETHAPAGLAHRGVGRDGHGLERHPVLRSHARSSGRARPQSHLPSRQAKAVAERRA